MKNQKISTVEEEVLQHIKENGKHSIEVLFANSSQIEFRCFFTKNEKAYSYFDIGVSRRFASKMGFDLPLLSGKSKQF